MSHCDDRFLLEYLFDILWDDRFVRIIQCRGRLIKNDQLW